MKNYAHFSLAILSCKGLILKTNKEAMEDYPAYVLHITDFSSGRKDPLKKEVRVSDCEVQIRDLLTIETTKGIKAGWEHIEG